MSRPTIRPQSNSGRKPFDGRAAYARSGTRAASQHAASRDALGGASRDARPVASRDGRIPRAASSFLTPRVAIGAVAAVFAVAVTAFALQPGGTLFDPSEFVGATSQQLASQSHTQAFDTNRSVEDGQANKQAEEDKSSQADVAPAATAELTDTGEAMSVYRVSDGQTGLSVAGGGGGASSGDTVIGPVVGPGDSGSSGSSGDSDNTGGGSDPQAPLDLNPTTPEVPGDLYFGTSLDFPAAGLDFDAEGTVPEVNLDFNTEDLFGVLTSLYYGEVLTDYKILCAAYYYAYVGEDRYQLKAFGENFKVGAYPAVVDSDTLSVEFSFRVNAESPWHTTTVSFDVLPGKVVVEGYGGAVLESTNVFLGQTVDLSGYYKDVYTAAHSADIAAPADGFDMGELPIDDDGGTSFVLEGLFPGWSETVNGPCVGPVYTAREKGLVILKPLPMEPLPAGFEASYSYWMLYGWLPTWGAVLTACPPSDHLVVPEGVQALDDMLFFFADAQVKTIDLPSTLSHFDPFTFSWSFNLSVTDAFVVSEDNPLYGSVDGMLFDKATDSIIGIPSARTRVEVPDSMTGITIPSNNSITDLRFCSDYIPDADFEFLQNATVTVPAAQYVEYLIAWGDALEQGGNVLVPDTGEPIDVVTRDGAVISADGRTLYQILPEACGVYFVPEGVEVVASGAADKCTSVDTLVVPASVTRLEAGSLAQGLFTRVLFEGANPCAIEAGALNVDGFCQVRLQVRASAYTDYGQKLDESLGAGAADALLEANDFSVEEKDGFTLLVDNLCTPAGAPLPDASNQTILIDAPRDLEVFSASPTGYEVTRIDAEAFADSPTLWLVDVPESVKSIGDRAFSGCMNLQLLLAESSDEISLGSGIFVGCDSLRNIAFNAACATLSDASIYDTVNAMVGYAYAPAGAEGYESWNYGWGDYFQTSSARYCIEVSPAGALLYGPASKDNPDLWLQSGQACYLLGASRVSGQVAIDPNTTCIEDYVFMGCDGLTGIMAGGMDNVRMIGGAAFAYSSLSGAVNLSDQVSFVGADAYRGTAVSLLCVDGSASADGSRKGLMALSEEAFRDCKQLRSVEVTGASALNAINSAAFEGCSSLVDVRFGEGCVVASIDKDVFFGCSSLTTLTLPATVVSLGYNLLGDTSVEALTITSDLPPDLTLATLGSSYAFKEYDESFSVMLANSTPEKEESFVHRWKYYLVGCLPSDELTPEQDLAGQNEAHRLLGLAPLEALS